MKIKILIPIYNDWRSVSELLKNIDQQINDLNDELSVLIVNDGSNEEKEEFSEFKNIKSIKIINMKENKGHARCNAAGLKYIFENEDFDYVIPMDGDGEDRPEEIKLLIEKSKDYPDDVITANRVKRSEGLLFKFCYEAHKLLTLIFTGQNIKFGNFTLLPKLIVEKMVNEKATWNSFSGSLCKVSKERKSILSTRGNRYFGPSKMSFLNLIQHSLSIISVFKFTWLARSIIFLLIYCYFISNFISIITLIPVVVIIVMNAMIFTLSGRENLNEYKNSLTNISNIDNIKE
jgi:cellulose synthase/poly-beta-1,6-N-acetylglucosamine synthase-like glycosyltransferase